MPGTSLAQIVKWLFTFSCYSVCAAARVQYSIDRPEPDGTTYNKLYDSNSRSTSIVYSQNDRSYDRQQRGGSSTGGVRRSYNLECYSCMSQHVERMFPGTYEMLYKEPRTFTNSCDRSSLDVRVLKRYKKSCSDMCIELQFEDKILGIRRHTYLRGCISDILNYNTTAVSMFTYRTYCAHVRMKNLFRRGRNPNFGFAEHDTVYLCSCHSNLCNGSLQLRRWSIGVFILHCLLMVALHYT